MADNEENEAHNATEEQKEPPQQQEVRVQLAEGQGKRDPVSSVESAQLRSLSDVYRHHAEMLDEQRGQLQGLKDLHATYKEALEYLTGTIGEWKDFISQEKERAQTQSPPGAGKPKKPFGGVGW